MTCIADALLRRNSLFGAGKARAGAAGQAACAAAAWRIESACAGLAGGSGAAATDEAVARRAHTWSRQKQEGSSAVVLLPSKHNITFWARRPP